MCVDKSDTGLLASDTLIHLRPLSVGYAAAPDPRAHISPCAQYITNLTFPENFPPPPTEAKLELSPAYA